MILNGTTKTLSLQINTMKTTHEFGWYKKNQIHQKSELTVKNSAARIYFSHV